MLKNQLYVLLGLSISWTVIQTVSLSTQAFGAAKEREISDCIGARISSWAPEWLKAEEIPAAFNEVPLLDGLWLGPMSFNSKSSTFAVKTSPVFEKLEPLVLKSPAVKCVGSFISNSGRAGFDPALGVAMIHSSTTSLAKFVADVHAKGWNALQVDIESLPESVAEDYEKFLDRLIQLCTPLHMRVSIALHAKTSSQGGYEGARFQRWEKLREKNLDLIVMAYDEHWSTSDPGPIASLKWVDAVVQYAQSVLPSDKFVLALGNYGYRWTQVATRNGKAKHWLGVPLMSFELDRLVRSAKHAKNLPLADRADGLKYMLGPHDVVAFEDSKSLKLKIDHFSSLKIPVQRFAIWRLGEGPVSKP